MIKYNYNSLFNNTFLTKIKYYLLLGLCLLFLPGCEHKSDSKLIDSAAVNGMNRFHFKMTAADIKTLEKYQNKLSAEDKSNRENYYCGQYNGKTVRFAKDYLFMPMTYADINFFKQNGWQYKIRWCDDPIISFSVVAEWPSLASGRKHFGFEKLDWGTYDQYLIQANRVNNIDYNNAVIFVYGLINNIDDEIISNNGKDLKAYLNNLLRRFKSQNAVIVKQLLRRDLQLYQVDVRRPKSEVITVYWHVKNQQIDFIAECRPNQQKIYSWCISHFFPGNEPKSVASFMVTEENIRDWQLLIQKSAELFNSFVINYPKK